MGSARAPATDVVEGAQAPAPPTPELAAATPRRPRGPSACGDWLVRLAFVAAGLVAWEIYAPHVNPIFLRSPSAVARAFGELLRDGSLLKAIGQSLHNLLIGFAIALVVGLALGVVSAR